MLSCGAAMDPRACLAAPQASIQQRSAASPTSLLLPFWWKHPLRVRIAGCHHWVRPPGTRGRGVRHLPQVQNVMGSPKPQQSRNTSMKYVQKNQNQQFTKNNMLNRIRTKILNRNSKWNLSKLLKTHSVKRNCQLWHFAQLKMRLKRSGFKK